MGRSVRTTSAHPGTTLILDALAARFGGTAYMVIQLAAALERRADVERVYVVTQRGSIVDRGLTGSRTVRKLALPAPRRGELLWRLAWEAVRLPGLVRRVGADAVFSASGMQPRRLDCRFVSMIANPVPYLDRHGPANTLRRYAVRRTVRHAAAVYVPSTHMLALASLPASARAVPLGVDRERFPPHSRAGTEILYVGDFYEHKRHDLIHAAWLRLDEPRPVLRFLGNPAVATEHFATLRDRVRDPKVVFHANASFTELLDAYARARFIVLPSERESFSMPLAEAVSMGLPALIRDDPVLSETGGPGALIVEQQTPEAWAAGMARLLEDDELHTELAEAGAAYGLRYSWDALAGEIVADAVRGGGE